MVSNGFQIVPHGTFLVNICSPGSGPICSEKIVDKIKKYYIMHTFFAILNIVIVLLVAGLKNIKKK